jgi:hypothetical protein
MMNFKAPLEPVPHLMWEVWGWKGRGLVFGRVSQIEKISKPNVPDFILINNLSTHTLFKYVIRAIVM